MPQLCVPVVTPLREGKVDRAGLTALLRWLAAQGADVLFVSGTTGEHPRLDAAARAAVLETSVAADARGRDGRRVPVWVGVTGATVEDTFALHRAAVEGGADGVVAAPLAVAGLTEVDAVGLLADLLGPVPLYLYENPDLSGGRLLDPDRVDLPLDGVKISAPADAVRPWLERQPTWVGLPEAWYTLAGAPTPPVGVVMGMANVFPAEWRRLLEGETGLRARFDAWTEATVHDGRRRTVACAKLGLTLRGVIGSAEVAPGTPPAAPDAAGRLGVLLGGA